MWPIILIHGPVKTQRRTRLDSPNQLKRPRE